MAQGHDKLFPPNTGETFANFAAKARTNQSAINTLHSGASAPTTPEDRQLWLDTSVSPNVLKIYDQASATWKTLDFLDVLIKEVVDARGTAAKLDARLDQALNEDGTLKASTTLNPDEFKGVTGTPTRTSATVFTKSGDQSAIYTVNRRVKMTPGPNYSRVTAVSFAAGTTTVTVADSNVPVGITAADVGIIDPTAATTGVDAKSLASPSGGTIEDYIATDIIRARRGLAALLQDFDQDPATTTGLTWGFKSGLLPDGTLKASGTLALTASATNYIELDLKSGGITANTTGFTAGKIPLRQVVTDATSQTSSTDKRPFLQAPAADYDAVKLTNRTAAASAVGDVVALDTANDSSVVLADVQGSLKTFVVARAVISDLAAGEYARSGPVPLVKVTGAVTRGNYLRKSATTKVLEDSGTAMDGTASQPKGTVGVALTAAAGPGAGTVTAFLFGTTIAAAIRVKVGSFTRDMTTASGTQAITGVGFTPKAVIFLVTRSGVADQMSIGLSDNTTEVVLSNRATGFAANTTLSIHIDQTGGAVYDGVINSFDADGFTVSWTRTGATTGTLDILYLAIG